MEKMIDLGVSYENPPSPVKTSGSKKRKSYPTLYISGVKGLEPEIGDVYGNFRGKVISVSSRNSESDGSTVSCEIEIHEISLNDEEREDGNGLEKALDAIASEKIEDGEEDE